MKSGFIAVCALLSGLAAHALATPAAAQDTTTQPAPTAQDFSQDQLESFAVAVVRVDEIGRKWLPQIQSAPDEQAATELRQQANAEMVEAVEAEGLSADEYNRIYLAAQSDPELNQRIMDMIEEPAQ
jgi:hypothetical protein